MPTFELVKDFVEKYFENVTFNKTQLSFHARCPLCGDSKKSRVKKRFHLKFIPNASQNAVIWHCFNCGRGKGETFYTLYGEILRLSGEDAYRAVEGYDLEAAMKRLKSHLKPPKIEYVDNIDDKWEYLNWIYEDCKPLDSIIDKSYDKILENFREERKIPKTAGLMIARKGKYKGRIIIPIREPYDHDIYYFQARAVGKQEPKYLNPPLKKSFVPWEHGFQRDKYIIVTEGILDSHAAAPQGTSCLGASINDKFLERLFTKTDKGVIIALDNDPIGKQEVKRIIEESKYAQQLIFFLMPPEYKDIKDLNELRVKYPDLNIYELVVNNAKSSFVTFINIQING